MLSISIAMQCGSSSIQLQKKQRTDDKLGLALLDFEFLDCPICIEPLSAPIFQCDNGHLACSLCCPRLKNKCSICALPIGDKRCRAMENVIESVFIPCSNAVFGCTKNVFYRELSTHEKECAFSRCSCPVQDCNYTAPYKDLYNHYYSNHLKVYSQRPRLDMFTSGISFPLRLNINNQLLILREYEKCLLFAIQSFRKPYGVYVTVSYIAPSSPEVEEFSYHLSYTVDGHNMIFNSPEVKRIPKVSFQPPEGIIMMIPLSSISCELLQMDICIKSKNQL